MSRVLRRSGDAVVQHCNIIGWQPKRIVQVGVGLHCQEIDCMVEAWENVEFLGFEPNSNVFNQAKDIYPGRLVPTAITNSKGERRLWIKYRHLEGSSLRKVSTISRPVETDTLDNLVPYQRDTLLWLDCEGSELEALEGGTATLAGCPMVNIEMTGSPFSEEAWPEPVDVHEHLEGFGYFLQWVHTNRAAAGQFDALYVQHLLFRPRYCNCPPEIRRWHKLGS